MLKYILFFLTCLVALIFHHFHKKKDTQYDVIIHKSAQRHQVPFSLIKAVIKKESSFLAHRKGRSGEYGLMQIMPIAADEWSRLSKKKKLQDYNVLLDPEINIDIGTYLLSRNLYKWREYDDQVILALAEYNAGIGQMRKEKWPPQSKKEKVLERITFPMTKKYVSDILLFRNDYLEHDK